MSDRARNGALLVLLILCSPACNSGGTARTGESPASSAAGSAAISGQGGSAGMRVAAAGTGVAGRRSPLECTPRNDGPVQCGGVTCPAQAEFEHNSCFVPCCLMFEDAERCGFRGTSPAFTTDCVLPAVADPSCDEVVQFQGCCEPVRRVCGIIGGFSPGCSTMSSFVTLPKSPKACGGDEADGGTR